MTASNAQVIVKQENKPSALTERRRQELEAMREEIDVTCEIFRMDDYDAKHLARAVFLARVTNGLVPKSFEGDVNAIYIMSKKAEQMKVDIIEVLQGGYFVHGKWGWSAEFMVNRVLGIGFFAKIEYESGGDLKDNTAWMRAIGIYADGSKAVGTTVSLKMAAEEGWSTKNGSKWKTMPALMLRKRAQTFMIREFAPHCFSGDTRTHDELEDIAAQAHRGTVIDSTPSEEATTPSAITDAGMKDNEEKQRMEIFNKVESKLAEVLMSRGGGPEVKAEIEQAIGLPFDKLESQSTKVLLAVFQALKGLK